MTDFGRIQKKRVDVGTVLAAWRPLKLGPATHMSRMQQWGQRNKKHSLGGVFGSLGSWLRESSQTVKGKQSQSSMANLANLQPFPQVALWFPKRGGLDTVGDGAKEVLKEICPNKASWEEKLLDVHNKVLQVFPVQDMKEVSGEHGWTVEATEHALCEVRRYRRKAGRFRKGTQEEALRSQKVRQERLKKVWRE